jgi:hypothetical protein
METIIHSRMITRAVYLEAEIDARLITTLKQTPHGSIGLFCSIQGRSGCGGQQREPGVSTPAAPLILRALWVRVPGQWPVWWEHSSHAVPTVRRCSSLWEWRTRAHGIGHVADPKFLVPFFSPYRDRPPLPHLSPENPPPFLLPFPSALLSTRSFE